MTTVNRTCGRPKATALDVMSSYTIPVVTVSIMQK